MLWTTHETICCCDILIFCRTKLYIDQLYIRMPTGSVLTANWQCFTGNRKIDSGCNVVNANKYAENADNTITQTKAQPATINRYQ